MAEQETNPLAAALMALTAGYQGYTQQKETNKAEMLNRTMLAVKMQADQQKQERDIEEHKLNMSVMQANLRLSDLNTRKAQLEYDNYLPPDEKERRLAKIEMSKQDLEDAKSALMKKNTPEAKGQYNTYLTATDPIEKNKAFSSLLFGSDYKPPDLMGLMAAKVQSGDMEGAKEIGDLIQGTKTSGKTKSTMEASIGRFHSQLNEYRRQRAHATSLAESGQLSEEEAEQLGMVKVGTTKIFGFGDPVYKYTKEEPKPDVYFDTFIAPQLEDQGLTQEQIAETKAGWLAAERYTQPQLDASDAGQDVDVTKLSEDELKEAAKTGVWPTK